VRKLLDRLTERPGQPVTDDDLIAELWPGDRSQARALQNRLWVAVSTLRKFGVGDALQRTGDGYAFHPRAVAVVR
jgi:DNA-binding winged helix-turn-helix (wHTH) protein